MGTPDFALPTLIALEEAGHHVKAVYTRPPSASGRGRRLIPSPVHSHAAARGFDVRTPSSLRSVEEIDAFLSLNVDVAVVAAYGMILPRAMLQGPVLGCINVHGSLLPRWRGAAPVQRAIMAGDREVGVSIMQMDEGMDTGGVRLMRGFEVDGMSAGRVMDLMAGMGAGMTLEVLADPDTHPPIAQPREGITYAAKLTKQEARIDFTGDAIDVVRRIRALSPAPGAWTDAPGERVKVLEAEAIETPIHGLPPGVPIGSWEIVSCSRGAVRILIAQRPGRGVVTGREMAAAFTARADARSAMEGRSKAEGRMHRGQIAC